jgi:ABC-type nitrate/sulfonate/bicarbonate transport system substrate-binding protein
MLFLRTALAGFMAAVLATAAASPSALAAPIKFEIPYNAVAYDAWPLWQAIDEHLFLRYGIDATPGGAMESPTVVASVLSGETRFAVVGEDAVIAADLNGADVVILTADTEKLLLAAFASPKLHSIADLKGNKIAISRSGTTTGFLAHYVLQQAGLLAGRDVAILPVGSLTNRIAALQSGAAEAAIIGPPITFKAEALGFHSIANMKDYDLYFYSSTLIAQRSWVEKHRAEALNVVRGYIAGGASIVHDKKDALAVLGKYTRTNDPEILDKTYQAFMTVLLRDPVPKLAALKTGLDENKLPKAKTADPASFIDTSFVRELEKDGFIASLYKQPPE